MAKKTVIYIRLVGWLQVGKSATVIPLNHTSALVRNWHECYTTPVRSIAQDGTTFETANTIYKLNAAGEPTMWVKRERGRERVG